MSLFILARAIQSTFRISWPTVVEATRGQLRAEDCDDRLESWSAELLAAARVDLVVRGEDEVSPQRSYVVMSNHASLYDIPVLYQALPLRLRMAAKAELFRVPLWGRAMEAAEFVRVDRKKGPLARAALLEAGERMKRAGVSLWVAPEGTRSKSGRLGPFKTGAFALARTTRLPILPVTILGTREILGKDGAVVHSGRRVEVVVHPAIAPENFPEANDALVALVRDVVAGPLPEEQR